MIGGCWACCLDLQLAAIVLLELGGRCSAHAIAGDACGPGKTCPTCDTDAVGVRAKDSCEAEALAMTKALLMRAAGIECSGSVNPHGGPCFSRHAVQQLAEIGCIGVSVTRTSSVQQWIERRPWVQLVPGPTKNLICAINEYKRKHYQLRCVVYDIQRAPLGRLAMLPGRSAS